MAEPVRVTPFDGSNDFTMWKLKMKAVLIKEKCWDAISEEWPEGATDRHKKKLQDLAYSEIILRLSDDVARQVFDTLKDVIQYSRDDLTIRKIMSAIVQKNDSLKVFKSKQQTKHEPKSEVMMANAKSRPKSKKKKFNKTSHNPPTENLAGRSQEYLSKKCTYCERVGHLVAACFKKKNEQKEKNTKENQNGHTNVLEFCPQYGNELFVCSDSIDHSGWMLDSGCTMHASHDKNAFSSISLINGGEVMLGDHTVLKIKGIGNVPLKMHDGVIRVLKNVKWVSNLRRNLLSESEFDKLGCHIVTYNGVREVSKDGKVLIKGVNRGGLYHVITSPEINFSQPKTKSNAKIEIWHARLGHIGNKGLHHLHKNGLINCVPTDLSFCETCIFGKKSAHNFKRSSFTVNKPLEYIHSDLWGPAQVLTIGGRNYFLSLIDHYSRKVWIYLLKTKDEAFANFKAWKTMVESQSNLKVKCLRTDNGLEFCNKAFDDFCAENGIKRHHTVPGTPQQNGTAERMNRTLLEKVRCMLISSGLKPSLWGEAVVTAAYLINRSPSSVIGFKTPQEMWTGKPPNLNHLRPFGCSAYAKVSQGKLKPRAVKCVMLSYPDGVKGYKLLEIVPGGYRVLTAISVTLMRMIFTSRIRLLMRLTNKAHLIV
ncbi:unnamed protein product [Rhodiola kirilowii]